MSVKTRQIKICTLLVKECPAEHIAHLTGEGHAGGKLICCVYSKCAEIW